MTFKQVTVTKVFMYEPFPLVNPATNAPVQYWFNGTNVGAAYSAAFNSTIGPGSKANIANWYNANPCAGTDGTKLVHPITGQNFICAFEITDNFGNYAIVDQCPYSTNGGLAPAFLGKDGVPTPLAVGDTFLTLSGVLKYQRAGTYRDTSAGGALFICAFGLNSDGSSQSYTGRNQPFTNAGLVTYSGSLVLSGFTPLTYTVPAQTALKTGIACAVRGARRMRAAPVLLALNLP